MKMRLRCLMRLSMLGLLLFGAASWAEAGDKHVLVLNSYYQGYKWTDDLTRGILATLKGSRKDLSISIEYMDTKRISDDQYFRTLSSIYRMKFKKQHFDLVITSDDDAYNFIRTYRDRLFKGTPVVFCGVNFFDPASMKGMANSTGVNEETDIKASLDIALKLHPATRNVYCIIEKTTTGRKIHDRMVEIVRTYRPGIRFTLLEELTMDELIAKVGQVPPDSIVLQTIFFRDSAGRNYTSDEVMGLLTKACKVPLYGLWDFDLGLGIIGGKLTSGYFQGEEAARRGLRILSGERADGIPVLMKSPNRYMFDYSRLRKFGIDLSALPDDSIVINKPMGLIDYYRKNRVFVLGIVVISLSIIAGVLLVSRSKLEKAARSVRMSEQRYRTIFENTGSATGIFNGSATLILANSEFEKLSGYSKSELENGLSWHDFTGEKELPLREDRHVTDGHDRSSSGFECRIRNRAAEVRDAYAVSERIPQTDLVVVSLLDITDRKRAEEEKLALEQQFQQTQKLESLGVLAGGIAHDFNNILGIITGYCSLVRMNGKAAERYIPQIEKAADRAAGLCRQMLAYAGKARIDKTQVNMTELVEEMVMMLKSTTSQKAVILLELAADIPLIRGDASHIRQLVMNLIINASEAIGDAHGEIRVSLARTEVREGQSEGDHLGTLIPAGWYVCLEVSDNGCGMDAETRRRIFEPFYTTKFAGRGLGMSVVLGIIKAHGGALQLASQPGEGTTLKVFLPARSDDVVGKRPIQAVFPETWRGSGTILLVEDETDIRYIAKAMLLELGFEVVEATNGREALEMYRKHADGITLVVTDMGMPVMDGYELFRELKRVCPGLPIIFSSGFGDAAVTSRIARADMAGLVSKPYTIEQLREVLKSVVEGGMPNQA